MKYEELQEDDENLNNEIFEILSDFDVRSYKEYKNLNILNKLKIENNIVAILKIHDEDAELNNVKTLKGYVKGFIDVYKSF